MNTIEFSKAVNSWIGLIWQEDAETKDWWKLASILYLEYLIYISWYVTNNR